MYYLSHFFSNFSGFLEQGGYWFLCIILIAEALPILGSLIPGHVVIIAAGFFVKLGVFDLWLVLVIGVVSASVGDVIGFIMGRRLGYAFLQKYGKYIFLSQEHIDRAKKIIHTHTGKTLVFSKVSPVIRSYVPFLVGTSGVENKAFWIFNSLGNFLWITLSVIAGYIFGASYHLAAAYFGKFIVAAIAASIFIVWSYRFVNRQFHVFRKYELFILGLNITSLWVLFKTMQDGFSTTSFLANFDIYANLFFYEYTQTILSKLSFIISNLAGIEILIALGLLVGLAHATRKKWRRAGIMIFSVSLSAITVPILKDIFLRARPENALAVLSDPSFPSAHATLAAAFFTSLIYVLAPSIRSWIFREAFIVVCVLCTLAIGMSRLVLNVHWASDVIAGWALGIFVATISVLMVRYVAGLILQDNK